MNRPDLANLSSNAPEWNQMLRPLRHDVESFSTMFLGVFPVALLRGGIRGLPLGLTTLPIYLRVRREE